MASLSPPQRPISWLECALLALAMVTGCLGWTEYAVRTNGLCSYLAPLMAVYLVAMLKLTAMPAHRNRLYLTVCALTVTILVSLWLMASWRVGIMLGLSPWHAIWAMRPYLAWTITTAFFSPSDSIRILAAYGLALACNWQAIR